MVHLREALSNGSKEVSHLISALTRQGSTPAAPLPVQGVQRLSRPNHKLQPDEITALVEAYRAGASLPTLAKQFGLHYQTVRAHLNRSGVERRECRPALDEQERAKIVELHGVGITNKEIARRLDISPRTVGRVLRAGR